MSQLCKGSLVAIERDARSFSQNRFPLDSRQVHAAGPANHDGAVATGQVLDGQGHGLRGSGKGDSGGEQQADEME